MQHQHPTPLSARGRSLVALVLGAATALAGCSQVGGGPAPLPTVTAVAQQPPATTSVLDAADPAELAVQASRAFFESAPLVVVVPTGDAGSELSGASIAISLGVPVLVAGGASTSDLLDGEFARLGTETVLGIGDVAALMPGAAATVEGTGSAEASAQVSAAQGIRTAEAPAEPDEDRASPVPVDLVAAPEHPAAVASLLGLELHETDPVPEGGQIAALGALDPAALAILRLEGTPEPGPSPAPGESPDGEPGGEAGLPVVAPTTRLSGVMALSDGSAAQAAAVGTARAAGTEILALPGGDPRSSSDAIAALAVTKPSAVVGLGPVFGSPDVLAWRVATAATGVELPGGTQLVFDGKRYAALYGTPGSGALGVLGEQGVPETIARAREHAAALQPHTQDAFVPSVEIIASIASAGAGPDGDYSNTRPISELRPLVDAAGEAGVYVVLDLQPGRTDFLTQARIYEELLSLPHVGLALDPEWRLKPNEVHLRQIGSVGIDEVNQVVEYLANLTRDNNLPQKLFILHQFRLSMVQDRDRLDTSRSELAMMIHVDGQGSQPAKTNTWNVLRNGAPPVHWGWKNFYDEDIPMLNPEQTMRIDPVPDLISYQ